MDTQAFKFQIVSPEQSLFDDEASMVVLPASRGEMGVLKDHAPMIVSLKPGIIDVYQDEEITNKIFVGGGFCNIHEEGCTVMADESIHVEELDPEHVEAYIQKTMQRLETVEEEIEREILESELSVAHAKMEIWRRISKINNQVK